MEDQEEVRTLAANILESYGYRVLACTDGASALLLAEQYPGPIDVIVTDVVMPGMTGRELAERLKASRPATKVVYVSGYSGDAIAKQGILKPGVAYLPKPFTPSALAGKVREALGPNRRMSTILVVDDEEGVRALFEQVLTTEGYQVVTAANGKEALRVLRERNLDLVITDLVMPEVEGIETIQKIRREQPALKIIAVSGAFGGQFLDNAKKLGASATLQKPISPDDLLHAVQRVLG